MANRVFLAVEWSCLVPASFLPVLALTRAHMATHRAFLAYWRGASYLLEG